MGTFPDFLECPVNPVLTVINTCTTSFGMLYIAGLQLMRSYGSTRGVKKIDDFLIVLIPMIMLKYS